MSLTGLKRNEISLSLR